MFLSRVSVSVFLPPFPLSINNEVFKKDKYSDVLIVFSSCISRIQEPLLPFLRVA